MVRPVWLDRKTMGVPSTERSRNPGPPSLALTGRMLDRPMKVSDKAGGGVAVDGTWLSLLGDRTLPHDDDPVGHRHCLLLIVGDVDESHAQLFLDFLELDPHRLTQLQVKIGQRLIEKKNGGTGRNGPGERHPLLLTAGKRFWITARLGRRGAHCATRHPQPP